MIQTLYPCFRHWSETGTIWVYSDPHFGDKDLATKTTRIPDEQQLANINGCVGRKDTLILLGDIGDPDIAAKLRGCKILVCGNHDGSGAKYSDVFTEIYSGPIFISEKVLLSHERIDFPFAFNIHGHDHAKQDVDDHHLNVCSNIIGYKPVNFNQLIKAGTFSKVITLHRSTINKRTK